jgi:hypothetical protein
MVTITPNIVNEVTEAIQDTISIKIAPEQVKPLLVSLVSPAVPVDPGQPVTP